MEKNTKEPVLPLELFKNRIFTTSMIVLFLLGIGMFGAILYVPLFGQLVLGESATNSGAVLTPLVLGMVVASTISGQIMSRTGKYKILAVVGAAVTAISLYILSGMTASTSQAELLVRMVLTGLGIGISFPIYTLVVQNAFDHSQLGVVTASTQLFRSIGGTVGTAVLGGILNSKLQSQLGDLSGDPFVQVLSSLHILNPGQKIDTNILQNVLTGDVREKIEQTINQLPPDFKLQVTGYFNNFLQKTRTAFASSVTEVFLIAGVFMALAFITTFFLPEIPLRKSHQMEPGESDTKPVGEPLI